MSTKALALVVAIMGAVPVVLGAVPLLDYARHARRGVRVEAVVVDVERLWLRELVYPVPRREFYGLTYEFRVAGVPVPGSGVYVQGRAITAPAAGKKIVIYYLPDDPGDSYVTDHHTLFDAALLVGFGALLWGGGGWYAWRRRAQRPPPG